MVRCWRSTTACARIIPKTLECVTQADLPEQIDLIVTETVSSFILGFGSWDTMSDLTDGYLRQAR
jgi:hypothetical protein